MCVCRVGDEGGDAAREEEQEEEQEGGEEESAMRGAMQFVFNIKMERGRVKRF